ncbi:hypothetical protein TNCV_446761 [Trichonephila clavipes]|nr:hypothetical protein TNCV_446761 [Trichonephila clavipes]
MTFIASNSRTSVIPSVMVSSQTDYTNSQMFCDEYRSNLGTYDHLYQWGDNLEKNCVLWIPLRSLWSTHFRSPEAAVRLLLSTGWGSVSSKSPKRHSCRDSDENKRCWGFPSDPLLML